MEVLDFGDSVLLFLLIEGEMHDEIEILFQLIKVISIRDLLISNLTFHYLTEKCGSFDNFFDCGLYDLGDVDFLWGARTVQVVIDVFKLIQFFDYSWQVFIVFGFQTLLKFSMGLFVLRFYLPDNLEILSSIFYFDSVEVFGIEFVSLDDDLCISLDVLFNFFELIQQKVKLRVARDKFKRVQL